MPKITKRTVDALIPDPNRDVQVMDTELIGFGVRMKPSGAAAYFVRYRTPGGGSRRLVIGKVGTLTPEEARKLARGKLSAVAAGADPSGERHKAREAMTVGEVCDWYLAAAAEGEILGRRGTQIKVTTLTMDHSRIKTHVKPFFGRRVVDSLSDNDIAHLQQNIAAGKTARTREGRGGMVTGGPGVAARTVRMLGAIFEHARRAKLIRANPAHGVRQLAEGTNDRRLSEDEIQALGEAVQASEENPVALAAIRFLLLSGFRRMEALSLRWSAVEAKSRCIVLADTKSGRQVRAVGTAALNSLDGLRGVSRGPWVFPAARGDGHFVGVPKVLERLYLAAGIQGATIHTLRHSFASVAADEGFNEMTVAALLGHARRGVTQRYVKVDRAAVLAADTVAAKLAGLLDGIATTVGVVPMRLR